MTRRTIEIGKKVLAEELEPLLKSLSVELIHSKEASRGLLEVQTTRPHVILVGEPLPDMSVEGFLADLRMLPDYGLKPKVVVVAPPERLPTIEALVENQLVLLSNSLPPMLLEEELSRIIGAAVRLKERLPVVVRAQVGPLPVQRFAQTVDISSTGMLLRSREVFPVGSKMEFEISLPHSSKPVMGEAEVVRRATAASDGVYGIGLRYDSFQATDRTRLIAHLQERLTFSELQTVPLPAEATRLAVVA